MGVQTHTAFFYGTLMAAEILYRVCYGTSKVHEFPILQRAASKLEIRPALLYNYCRHRVLEADYPAIIPQQGHTVRGTYVTGLTDDNIRKLDRFEGSQYSRQKVNVTILSDGQEKGEVVEAQTYIWSAGVDYLEKQEWDYEDFRKNKMHLWTDTSREFEDLDNAVLVELSDETDEEEMLRAAA
ncbi:related to disease resistance protein aig2 [Phialocephala subalpina]|uniref:Putative gamma-glutamylcyclotransferase n=1 Tax=Phialocephala subalpina TaxID=576137 RepID=A0A1L7XX27_9HELO|nr:related to disease resistance protein aig2 [Phialocephala subalpina]